MLSLPFAAYASNYVLKYSARLKVLKAHKTFDEVYTKRKQK